MTKKVLLYFAIMLAVVFLAWVIIINVSEEKDFEIIKKDGKTLYRVFDVYYEETDDSDMVLIDTSKGAMIAELYPQTAPITVANFKKLIKEGFYKDFIFHRVIEDFMIQTGDPTGTGNGGSKEEIKGEFSINGVDNKLSHKRGILSMARRGPAPGEKETKETMNSASSQFFIVHKDSTYLDGNYAAFGLLTYGYDVLDSIAKAETDQYDKPVTDQKLNKIIFISVVKE